MCYLTRPFHLVFQIYIILRFAFIRKLTLCLETWDKRTRCPSAYPAALHVPVAAQLVPVHTAGCEGGDGHGCVGGDRSCVPGRPQQDVINTDPWAQIVRVQNPGVPISYTHTRGTNRHSSVIHKTNNAFFYYTVYTGDSLYMAAKTTLEIEGARWWLIYQRSRFLPPE